MTVDESRRGVWRQMRGERGHDDDEPVLNIGGGGDNTGGMEARIARLEAAMDFVKSELAKLAGVPAELARVSERLNHVANRSEVERLGERVGNLPTKADVDVAIDRAAARTQRTVAVAGGLVTLAIAAMNYLPKLLH